MSRTAANILHSAYTLPIQGNTRTLLASFLNGIPDNVYFKDTESRFIAVSAAFAQRQKHLPEYFIGKRDFDLFGGDHAQQAFEDEKEIMRTGVGIIAKLEKEDWPDGSITWVISSKVPMYDADGIVIGTCGSSMDVTDSINKEKQLEAANRQLIEATRQAGMAEVATGVLHNVGNVLNTVNVAANILADRFRDSKVTSIYKVCALLRENSADLGGFFTKDPRASKLIPYLESLAETLDKERAETMAELSTLLKSIDHIKDVIWMQQSYASVAGMVEPLNLPETIEDAIKLSTNALQRHSIQVIREFAQTGPARAERHKVLQILVNLINNAKKAMETKEPSHRHLIIRVSFFDADHLCVRVIDNGIGIPPENITKIFSHGFTTKKDGHGFGLHSSAHAAKQMQGSLNAESEGIGKGATFTLSLPRWKEQLPELPAANVAGAKIARPI